MATTLRQRLTTNTLCSGSIKAQTGQNLPVSKNLVSFMITRTLLRFSGWELQVNAFAKTLRRLPMMESSSALLASASRSSVLGFAKVIRISDGSRLSNVSKKRLSKVWRRASPLWPPPPRPLPRPIPPPSWPPPRPRPLLPMAPCRSASSGPSSSFHPSSSSWSGRPARMPRRLWKIYTRYTHVNKPTVTW